MDLCKWLKIILVILAALADHFGCEPEPGKEKPNG